MRPSILGEWPGKGSNKQCCQIELPYVARVGRLVWRYQFGAGKAAHHWRRGWGEYIKRGEKVTGTASEGGFTWVVAVEELSAVGCKR